MDKIISKISELISKFAPKLGGFFWTIPAAAVLLIAFVVGLVLSFGGDLGKFKKAAKAAIATPTAANFQTTAKEMPIAVRKQYKEVKQTGKKPSDVISLDACVYTPYQVSGAARFPSLMTAFGMFAILLEFAFVLMGATQLLAFAVIILLAVIFRIIAGVVSRVALGSGVKTYNAYVEALDKNLKVEPHAGEYVQTAPGQEATVVEPMNAMGGDIPFASADEPIRPVVQDYAETVVQTPVYDDTFGEPERIEVEEDDSEPIVMAQPTESEAEIRARARAEAMARARAEQAQRAQAAQAARQAQAQNARQQAQAQTAQAASNDAGGMSAGAEEVIARIDKITQEGAPLSTMKEVALQLQKERAKPENKTPDRQKQLNDALSKLLKAMSGAKK